MTLNCRLVGSNTKLLTLSMCRWLCPVTGNGKVARNGVAENGDYNSATNSATVANSLATTVAENSATVASVDSSATRPIVASVDRALHRECVTQ